MSEITRGKKIAEGKTKRIWRISGTSEVLIESKDDITAGDGVKRDILESKGVLSTKTTSNCFQLLNEAGVATHFIAQEEGSIFRAHRVRMIPIELVARRVATGSYLQRNSEVSEGTVFKGLTMEFFLKDDARHDPLMIWDDSMGVFRLYDAHQPLSAGAIDVLSVEDLTPSHTREWWEKTIPKLRLVTTSVFLVLEEAWERQDVLLVDLKIECGETEDGRLLVADVIDNDSWRIWPGGDKDRMKDKQVYRNLKKPTPEEMNLIKDNYVWVAEATGKF